MTTLTSGANVITPTILLEFTEDSDGGNIVHAILGRANPDVTLRPGNLRTGTILLGFHGPTSETASNTARTLLTNGAVWTLLDDDRDSIELSFVRAGAVTRTLDDETRDAWTVSVAYQEVTVS